MSSLFRKEAVEHATRRIAGEVVIATPVAISTLSALSILTLTCSLLFACFATYSRKETVPGWLVPESGLIRVGARDGGIVEKLDVHEGDNVEAGAAIAHVRLSADVEAGDVGRALQRSLHSESFAAFDDAQAAEEKLKTQQAGMRVRRLEIQEEINESALRVRLLQDRVQLADRQVERGETLSKEGFLAPQQMDQLRAAVISASQDVEQGKIELLDLERQKRDVDDTLAGLPADFLGLAAKRAKERAALEERQTAAESETTLITTAPIDGRVLAIDVNLGQRVSPGATVATMSGVNSSLIAELYVPSRSAGFLQSGQAVRLMYQAFPYQTFGTARGLIKTISETAISPSDVTAPGVMVQEPVFRVRVSLERNTIQAYGRSIRLHPGMLLTADIITDKRSLFQFLFDPIYAAGRRG